MLRGTEKRQPLGRFGRANTIVLLTGTVVLLALVDGHNLLPAAAEGFAGPEPFDLSYLSAKAKGFVACRPAVWFQQPGMEKISMLVDQGLAILKQLGVAWPRDLRPEHIDQFVTAFATISEGTGKPGSRGLMLANSSLLIRMDRDYDWLGCVKTLLGQAKTLLGQDKTWKLEDIKEIHRDGVTIYRLGVVPPFGKSLYMHLPDRRSIVLLFASSKEGESDIWKLLYHSSGARQRNWGSGSKRAAKASFAVVLDNYRGHYTGLYKKDLDAKDLKILDAISFATFAIELGEGKPVRLVVDAKSAGRVSRLLKAFDGYARFVLEKVGEETADSENQDNSGDSEKLMIKLQKELMESRQVHRHGSRIEWQAFSGVRVGDLLEAMVIDKQGKAGETK